MRRVRDFLVWLYWGPFKRLVWLLPVGAALSLAAFLGRVLGRVPNARLFGMAEAARLVPGSDQSPAARLALARGAMVSFCLNDLEVLLFPRLDPRKTARLVRIEGRGRLDAALARGRGVMLAFGHFGANQTIMAAIGHAGYAMSQLSAPADVLNEKLPEKRGRAVRRTRELRWEHERSLPVRHINIFGNLKEAFACLRAGHVLGVALDGGGGERRVAAPFLDRQALFSTGAMRLALKTGAAVLPVFMLREPDHASRMIIEEPLEMVRPERGGLTEDQAAAENTRRFAAILDRYVRAYPEQYLYFLSFREAMARGGHEPFFTDGQGADDQPGGRAADRGAVGRPDKP